MKKHSKEREKNRQKKGTIKKIKKALATTKKPILKRKSSKSFWEQKGFGTKKPSKIKLHTKVDDNNKYIKTGIDGFDALFEEEYGLPSGASILIEGGPGSGKTIFCLATVNGMCKRGKKCLYMSFEEPEERLTDHMRHFNWDADEFIKKGLLRIKRFDALDVSRSVEALLSAAKKEQLFRYLEKNKITNFLVREVSAPTHVGTTFKEQGEAVSFLSDGIVILYSVIYSSGERTSAIEILKMRGVDFDKKIVEMKIINKKGVEINPDKILKKDDWTNFELT